jgi:cytoskeletal protein CcmA (bactofilin family)
MDKTAFIIPKGLRFEQTEQGIIIEHEGDIILQENLGSTIQKITSTKGDIHIYVPLETTEIIAPRGKIFTEHDLVAHRLEAQIIHSKASLHVKEQVITTAVLRVDGDIETLKLTAHGSVTIGGSARVEHVAVEGDLTISQDLTCEQLYCTDNVTVNRDIKANNIESKGTKFECKGNVKANELIADLASLTLKHTSEIGILRANNINIEGSSHQIKAIQAKDTVSISATEINADVLFCAHISISEESIGKIMVLETNHPPKPHRLKGCLQLVDLEGFIPNVDEFLQVRGINPSFLKREESRSVVEEDNIAVTLPPTEESYISKIEPDIIEEDSEEESDEHRPAMVIMTHAATSEEAIIDNEQVDDSSQPNDSDDKISDEPLKEEPLEEFFTSVMDKNLDDELLNDEDLAHRTSQDEDQGEDPLLEEVRLDVQTLLDLYETPPEALASLAKVLDEGDLYYFRDSLQKTWRRVMSFHQASNVLFPENLALLFNELSMKMSKLD